MRRLAEGGYRLEAVGDGAATMILYRIHAPQGTK
jgi:hypothetical protein